MATHLAPDPFDTAKLLTLPALHEGTQSDKWHGFEFHCRLENDTFELPETKEYRLPHLEAGLFDLKLDDVQLRSLDASSVSDYTTADEETYERIPDRSSADSEQVDDLWELPEVAERAKKAVLTSWDHFLKEDHVEPGPAYLAEAGADVFDAIVQTVSKSPIRRLRPDKFLDALYELSLGRPSIFFTWDMEKQAFVQRVKSCTVTGFTPELIEEVIMDVGSPGAILNKLRSCEVAATRSPTLITLNSVLHSCLSAVEAYMEDRRYEVVSILSLQHIYQGPRSLLRFLDQLADTIQEPRGEANVLSSLLSRWSSWKLQHPKFTSTLDSILAIVFTPALEQLAKALGLLNSGIDYLQVTQRAWIDDYGLAQVATEIHETLVLLQAVAPHIVVAMEASQYRNPFRLSLSWNQVSEAQENAGLYEEAAKANLLRLEHDEVSRRLFLHRESAPSLGSLEHQTRVNVLDTGLAGLLPLDAFPSELNMPDELYEVALACLQTQTTSSDALAVPLDEVIELSLSPLLFAQHRLLSYSILDLIFSSYGLHSHLHMLRQIHLFGDGTFAARLSAALFDDDLASGEGQRRTGSSTGLRIQSRESWPPASSELRLALMGVLSDSLKSAAMNSFEDSISFAIRDLSDEELELCRDVDSIHALDFLKLHYKPPNPVLEAVLSSDSLDKYDRIFKHVLRVLRVKSVAKSLLRAICSRGRSKNHVQDHKFRIEIQHLISTIAHYCHNIAIAAPWIRLQGAVESIEARLGAQDYHGTLQYGKSLEHLKQLHNTVLDNMLKSLLLKQKETKAMMALEEIFTTILRYAASLRRDFNDQNDNEATTEQLQEDFRRQARLFIEQVADASSRECGRTHLGNHDFEPFEHLLLMLDFDGYWTNR